MGLKQLEESSNEEIDLSVAAAALLAGIVTIGYTPAQATITAPDRRLYVGSSATPVHCQKKYHCHWRGTGANEANTATSAASGRRQTGDD